MIIFAGYLVGIVIICVRLVVLMIFQADYYGEEAIRVQERERTIKAARGYILDRNGVILGDNKTVCTISVVHNQINEPEKVIDMLNAELGIPKEELANVWERYYKVDKNHKRAVMGTGLGLSIVKNVLKLHNVQFGVDSEVGKGTCFWFEMEVKNGYRGF